jgi:hypothetical protein
MKSAFLSTCLSLFVVTAFAQGTVSFQNASSVFGWDPATNRNVTFGLTAAEYNPLLVAGANVSTNYAGVNLGGLRAALYFTAGSVADADWQTVTTLATTSQSSSPLASFRQSTSASPGAWWGGTRTLEGIPARNGTASLMVVVWDTSFTLDPFSPAAFAGLWGRSEVFSYTTPDTSLTTPWEYLPNNLTSFTIGIVPEPTIVSLAAMGAAMLLLLRPRAGR